MTAGDVTRDALPARAATLGYAGLIPFALGAIGALLLEDLDEAEWAARLSLYYGAVILSFLGGVHWGLVLRTRPARVSRVLAIGVVPGLVGWISLALPYEQGLAIQIGCFGAFWLYEHRVLGEPLLPPGYLELRRRLTIIVCILQVLTLLGAAGLS